MNEPFHQDHGGLDCNCLINGLSAPSHSCDGAFFLHVQSCLSELAKHFAAGGSDQEIWCPWRVAGGRGRWRRPWAPWNSMELGAIVGVPWEARPMSSGSAAKEFEAFARDCMQLAAQAPGASR